MTVTYIHKGEYSPGVIPEDPENAEIYLRAAREGRLRIVLIEGHRERWSPQALKAGVPTIVWINCMHAEGKPVTPRPVDEWRCAMSVLAWARMGLVRTQDPRPSDPGDFINFATAVGRMFLVDTIEDHFPAWRRGFHPNGSEAPRYNPPGSMIRVAA